MIKILTIIGTRPQYIKLKPLYDFLKKQDCIHIVVDTNQHYNNNVSSIFIKEFKLDINYNLCISNMNPLDFISNSIVSIKKILLKELPDIVIVMGDTNTTVAGSLVSNKMGFKVAHIESGIRCGSQKRPEEINRIITDTLSDIHFISREKDKANVNNPYYTGDLEYTLLNNMYNNGIIKERKFDDFILMTIHRNENMNFENINKIFNACFLSGEKFIFPIHHRTKKIIEELKINIPSNITVVEPKGYIEMIKTISKCKAIFSDSGGLVKISPFFGKKCLIPLDVTEYNDLLENNYAQLGLDFKWLINIMPVNRNYYYLSNSCEIIYGTLLKYLEK
jgi:UDP-GlcNAc3NAcA epimerase